MHKIWLKRPLLAVIVDGDEGLGVYVNASLGEKQIEEVLRRGLGRGGVVIVTEQKVYAVD